MLGRTEGERRKRKERRGTEGKGEKRDGRNRKRERETEEIERGRERDGRNRKRERETEEKGERREKEKKLITYSVVDQFFRIGLICEWNVSSQCFLSNEKLLRERENSGRKTEKKSRERGRENKEQRNVRRAEVNGVLLYQL